MAYYVFDDAKNLFEGMTREQIVNAIANATGLTPEEIDADAVTTAIKEANAQKSVSLWVGTQNEYNAIQQPDENTLYVVTDPHETNELQSQINQLQSEVDNIVAASTTNASGYIIEKLESDPQPLVYNSTFQWYEVANNFVVPEGAEILEYCWKRYEADNHTNDIYASRESDTVVKVVYHSNAQETGNFILSLVISYPQPITLPELTDIRVGYDGTVYGSAGEAVRKQAFETRFHDYIKQALLNLLAHVAYIDGNGQQYYNALEAAMYMTAGVTSITAVFDQGANVIYDTASLDDLRQYLTVTAYYEDNTHEVITDYILSGTIEAGTSTITASYGGKTATFEATITSTLIVSDILTLDGIKNTRSGHNESAVNWEDLSGNNNDFIKLSGANSVVWGNDHAIFNATNRILQLNGTDLFNGLTEFSVEFVASITGNGSTSQGGTYRGEIFIGGKIGGHNFRIDTVGTTIYRPQIVGAYGDFATNQNEVKHFVISCTATEAKFYANGVLVDTISASLPISNKTVYNIGGNVDGTTKNYFVNANVYRLAISSTALTAAEVASRYSACKARFGF